MNVPVSLSRVTCCHFGSSWTTSRRWRIHWGAGRSQAGNHTRLTPTCCSACRGSAWIFWGFCWACPYDRARTSLGSGWSSCGEGCGASRRPSRPVISRTRWHSSHRPSFAATLGTGRHRKRSFWTLSWTSRLFWIVTQLRRIRVVLPFDISSEILTHTNNYNRQPSFLLCFALPTPQNCFISVLQGSYWGISQKKTKSIIWKEEEPKPRPLLCASKDCGLTFSRLLRSTRLMHLDWSSIFCFECPDHLLSRDRRPLPS